MSARNKVSAQILPSGGTKQTWIAMDMFLSCGMPSDRPHGAWVFNKRPLGLIALLFN